MCVPTWQAVVTLACFVWSTFASVGFMAEMVSIPAQLHAASCVLAHTVHSMAGGPRSQAACTVPHCALLPRTGYLAILRKNCCASVCVGPDQPMHALVAYQMR